MTDDVSPPGEEPEEHDESVENAPARHAAPDDGSQHDGSTDTPGVQEVPPGMLPLVEPVFGKWAFWICAVPFVIYLGGTSVGTYLENIRKTIPAHTMRGSVKSQVEVLKAQINDLSSEESQAMLARLDPDSVIEAMNDENSSFDDLIKKCGKLLTDDLANLPAPVDSSAKTAKAFLAHFFRLEEMIDEGEVDLILEEHEEFILTQNFDPSQVPQLTASWYPVNYSIACIASLIAVLVALPGYLKIPFRVSPLAVGVGVVGIVVWIGLWWLDKNVTHIAEYFGASHRAGFNPWRELKDNPSWMYTFVAIRILGLCVVIPIAEEFFARGFLMRYIEDIDWDQIPMGEATWKGLAGIFVYAAVTHPGEVIAALAWFGLVTWLYLKTKNVWDCVIAHAVTNALLAAFVLQTNIWELW